MSNCSSVSRQPLKMFVHLKFVSKIFSRTSEAISGLDRSRFFSRRPQNLCASKNPCDSINLGTRKSTRCKDPTTPRNPCGQTPERDPCACKDASESKNPCVQTLEQDPCKSKATICKDASEFENPCGQIPKRDPCPIAPRNPCDQMLETNVFMPKKTSECSKGPLSGKVAVITGGSVGIGYHVAMAILKNGGNVMLGDIKVEEGKRVIYDIIEKFGYSRSAFIKCDVTEPRDMNCLFKAALSEFKQIDIVVNNAGIIEEDPFERILDINVKGLVHGTLLGFKHMRRNRNGGTIINLASILGHQPFFGCPVYTGTKHFVIGFSRSMGHDYYYKQTNVKVMSFCPGVTITDLIEDSIKTKPLPDFGDTNKELYKALYELPTQSAEACGNHIITVLANDKNGSTWVSEGNEIYQVKIPDRHTLRVPGPCKAACRESK